MRVLGVTLLTLGVADLVALNLWLAPAARTEWAAETPELAMDQVEAPVEAPAPEEPALELVVPLDEPDAQPVEELAEELAEEPVEAVPPSLPETTRIYFRTASARLTPRAARNLRRMAREASASQRFTIVGHADHRGPEGYNERLGLRRSRAVARVLRRAGVSADRIEVISEGERGAGRTEIWRDRRAEVGPE